MELLRVIFRTHIHNYSRSSYLLLQCNNSNSIFFLTKSDLLEIYRFHSITFQEQGTIKIPITMEKNIKMVSNNPYALIFSVSICNKKNNSKKGRKLIIIIYLTLKK